MRESIGATMSALECDDPWPWRHPHIPRTWTADQALEVADFLQTLLDDIAQVYDLHALRRMRSAPAEE